MRGLGKVSLALCACVGAALLPATNAYAAAPTISALSPNNGASVGGNFVYITGTGFNNETTVKFGGVAAGHATYESPTKVRVTAVARPGSADVDVTVTNSGGTSALTPADQYAYDPPPSQQWLGLNSNSAGGTGTISDFTAHGIVYDRGGGSYTKTGLDWGAGGVPSPGDDLSKSLAAGMIPVITIENMNAAGLPRGTTMIEEYVSGFITSAKAIRAMYPGKQILFEPINEPWDDARKNGERALAEAQYAKIIAALLPACQSEGIPLESIYVGAYGEEWVKNMYASLASEPAAQEIVERKIQGWYFHPYGPPRGSFGGNREGVESVPVVRREMLSGENNIIISEIGYWTPDVNEGKYEFGPASSHASNSTQAAGWLKETLEHALPYHREGWLRALVVFSRTYGGWAMQLGTGALTAQGEALETFADAVQGWSSQSVPYSASAETPIKGVSCASSSVCTLVGLAETSYGSHLDEPIADRWDGTSWSTQSVPAPAGSTSSSLVDVSCGSVTACMAVGNDTVSHNPSSFSELWDGTSWSVKPVALPAGATSVSISAVSCSSTTACVASGTFSTASHKAPLVYADSWNGTSWSLQPALPIPPEAASDSASSVSCTSANACTIAGASEPAGGPQRLMVQRWNGTSWSLQTAANPPEFGSGTLEGVSCSYASDCMAVGYYYKPGATQMLGFSEVWDGFAWTVEPMPTWAGAEESRFSGVSCIVTMACTSVGFAAPSEAPVAERWQPDTWTMELPSYLAGTTTYLTKVSCISSTACAAIGTESSPTAGTVPLVEIHP